MGHQLCLSFYYCPKLKGINMEVIGLTKQSKNNLLFLITFRLPKYFQIDKKVMDVWAENLNCTKDSNNNSYTEYEVIYLWVLSTGRVWLDLLIICNRWTLFLYFNFYNSSISTLNSQITKVQSTWFKTWKNLSGTTNIFFPCFYPEFVRQQ